MNMRRLMRSRQGLAASRATGLPGVPVKLYRLAYFRGYTTSKLRYAGMQACRYAGYVTCIFAPSLPKIKRVKKAVARANPLLLRFCHLIIIFFPSHLKTTDWRRSPSHPSYYILVSKSDGS